MFRRIAMVAVVTGACRGQDPVRMDQIVQYYAAGQQFMGSVLVARGEEVLLSKGYGSANLEWNVPNSSRTRFRLSWLTKQFTAASILLLEERGKLSVNDPLKRYLPDAPEAWNKITIFHLLTQTSGIPDYTTFPDFPKLRPLAVTPAQLVARFRDKPLDFEPGEKSGPGNSGYVLLGCLIERIGGESYEKFVRENIFTPLGMEDSGYDSSTAVLPQRASGYVFGKNGYEHAGFIHMSAFHSAGALYSTTGDLLKWEHGLFGGKLLQASSLEKMITPFKNNDAFGLLVHTIGTHKVIEYGGDIRGFISRMAYYPEDQLTVIVLGNVFGLAPGQIASKLAAIGHGETVKLLGERKEVALDPKVLERYVGVYRMPNGLTVVITLDGDRLFSKLTNQGPVQILPESETIFFLSSVDTQFEFPTNDGRGKATQVILHQNGRGTAARRLDDAEARQLTDAAAAAAKRFKEQKPAPGSEAALRKLMIDDIRLGKPDYGRMSIGLAAAMRQQLSGLQSNLIELGGVQSVSFAGVSPGGADFYVVKFENGALEYAISLAPDGKVESCFTRAE
jgi:CubicO group peptidase (beta-lactamase class C family)